MLEVFRCGLLYALELWRVLGVLEVMRCVLLCTLKDLAGGL